MVFTGVIGKVFSRFATPADQNDDPIRVYHYEDPRFPHHLTGLTDENGNRFAAWAYDAAGGRGVKVFTTAGFAHFPPTDLRQTKSLRVMPVSERARIR